MSVSVEEIKDYLEGYDDQKYIVAVESNYYSREIFLIIHDPEKGKRIEKHKLKPFLWMKTPEIEKLYKGDRREIKKKMQEYSIKITPLNPNDENGNPIERLENGYKFMVSSSKSTYGELIRFFKDGGMDIFSEEHRSNFLTISPTEQFLIQTGKRLFKGMDDYDDIHRFSFDIETTGLDPNVSRIFQIGMKDNRDFTHVLSIEGETDREIDTREAEAITTFFKVINHLKPAIIAGYNSENFDWYFIVKRAEILGIEITRVAKTLSNVPFFRKKQTLKMGPEMEYYEQTTMWGYNIMDVYHAVRRAQAINSSIKEASLKYITKYSNAAKPNRVYVPGDRIGKTWADTENRYWFNDTNGQWGIISNDTLPEGTEEVTGKYIIERYLIDDLWETEKVDNIFNQATFLLSKILPTTFMRSSTMGTAATWKLLMLGWSYRKGLAIPHTQPLRPFTGGLSRLLEVGYARNVVKFDFASLYPSIQLTHNVFTDADSTGAMRGLLQYNYDYRNLYKKLKSDYAKEGDKAKSEYYDKKQLPLKILNNGMFGSISAPNVFPWGDTNMGEKITCTGRQYLRHMIRFFNEKGFKPLVGDSVTHDTPVYIRYFDGTIDIKSICDLFNEDSEYIDLDGLRDYEKKPYEVLTVNGWKKINYVYRHGTTKQIHRVSTKDRLVCVTEDHSLFQNGVQIKPSSLKRGDNIDVYTNLENFETVNDISPKKAWLYGFFLGDGSANCLLRSKKYISRKTGKIKLHKTNRSDWKISNSNLEFLEELKNILSSEFNVTGLIKDHMKSTGVYNLVFHKAELSRLFCSDFYTSYREKKVPSYILNSSNEIKKAFLDGVCASDGYGNTLETCSAIGMKSQVAMAGIGLLFNNLGVEYKIITRKDKENFISFILKNRNRNMSSFTSKTLKKTNEVWTNEIISNKDKNNYVYDISTEDGTFIGGIGLINLKNTDGFNFSIPKNVDEHTYTSTGRHHFNKEGKTYTGIEAFVAEYNDKYMFGVMGLDVDEMCTATINLSRKNYADLIDGKVKLVGNTIKSKKMPVYISEFIDIGIRMLLDGNGSGFVKEYYDTIERIYNQEIPLSKIANKARVKMSVDEYRKKSKMVNKAGNPLPKQAHMELILENNLIVDLGDTIYYVNTGTKKSDGDIQTKTNKLTKEKEMIVNCRLIPKDQIENDPNLTGDYNVVKYLDAFNKRIEPLLVCFHPDVRETILISTPDKRQYFTDKQLELTSGYPFNPEDQDTIEELLEITEQELNFWESIGLSPTYMFEEYNILDKYSELNNKNSERSIA